MLEAEPSADIFSSDSYLGDYLENLTFPVISANVHSTNPKLNGTIKPFHIFEKYQLAVIGATTEETPDISSVDKEVTTFTNVVKAVQDTVDLIRSTTNITRIVALTHIGYEEDQRLAQETTGLHLIMGGHSHTKLGSEADSEGAYPTIVKNKDGDEVFIVTAWRWGEYLGYIDVTFDADGKILEYHGAPIHLTNQTKQDPDYQAQVDKWRAPFAEEMAKVVGQSNVVLDQTTCQLQECLLGDFIAEYVGILTSRMGLELQITNYTSLVQRDGCISSKFQYPDLCNHECRRYPIHHRCR